MCVGAELDHDAALEGANGSRRPFVDHLRPVTPTGRVVDSDPDMLVRSKPTSPAALELDPPQTPGTGIPLEAECQDSAEEVATGPILASCTQLETLYQDRPRTPGRENQQDWALCGSVGDADGEMDAALAWLPAASYVRAPKTPGRDIIWSRRDSGYRRKAAINSDSGRAPSPRCLSDSSSGSLEAEETWVSSGVRAKPLQGLENVPGRLCEGSWPETEGSFFKRKQKRCQRRWRLHQRHRALQRVGASLSCHRRRSPGEESRILHNVWKDGLDGEDARLLRCAYGRLQAEDCGWGWTGHPVWTPHPHILEAARDRSAGLFPNKRWPRSKPWLVLVISRSAERQGRCDRCFCW